MDTFPELKINYRLHTVTVPYSGSVTEEHEDYATNRKSDGIKKLNKVVSKRNELNVYSIPLSPCKF